MEGYIRNTVDGKPFCFIRADSGLDSIFLHRDNFHGDWDELIRLYEIAKTEKTKLRVIFELEEGQKGPRANKCYIDKEN